MSELINNINSIIWSNALIYLCLGAGLFFSIITRFVQVRHIKEMCRLLYKSKGSEQGISSFQALAVSLSGRVGTGNIAGVAAAIGFGGPGAVFWMWIVAFLGAATAYVESTNAQIYKEEFNGQYRGGPAYYIEKVTNQKWYAWVFALATILACGFLLPTVQSNSMGSAVALAFGSGDLVSTGMGEYGSTKLLTAITMVILLGFIIIGGVKRIAQFTQFIVPFMALAYMLVAVAIIGLNANKVLDILTLIVTDAFSPMAGVGAAIGWGVKRGIYSNEAGQGTGPHAAAAAEVEHPAQQGLVQAFSVYIDTLLICTATAIMILLTDSYNVISAIPNEYLIQHLADNVNPNSPAFTQLAVDSVFNGVGAPFIAFSLLFFSFTTLLAYYYIAENNVAYIQRTFNIPALTWWLKIVILFAVFYGTINSASIAWGLGDIGVGLMAWLNIIGILIIFFIAKPSIKALADYERQKKLGVETYTFNPKELGIEKADFWQDRLKNKSSELKQ